jgi:hypothetical protein
VLNNLPDLLRDPIENIRQGAMAHGVDVYLLMKDLNDTVLVAQDN